MMNNLSTSPSTKSIVAGELDPQAVEMANAHSLYTHGTWSGRVIQAYVDWRSVYRAFALSPGLAANVEILLVPIATQTFAELLIHNSRRPC